MEIPDGVETIAPACFIGHEEIEGVKIPDSVTIVGEEAFKDCTNLSSASFSNCMVIPYEAFAGCSNLSEVSFPECKVVYSRAFNQCYSLNAISLPMCSTIYGEVFRDCTNLTKAYIPLCGNIPHSTFLNCQSLSQLIVGTSLSKICYLADTGALSSTPIAKSSYLGYFGSIYVPDSLVLEYRSAKYWSTYSSRITGVSNLPPEIESEEEIEGDHTM